MTNVLKQLAQYQVDLQGKTLVSTGDELNLRDVRAYISNLAFPSAIFPNPTYYPRTPYKKIQSGSVPFLATAAGKPQTNIPVATNPYTPIPTTGLPTASTGTTYTQYNSYGWYVQQPHQKLAQNPLPTRDAYAYTGNSLP